MANLTETPNSSKKVLIIEDEGEIALVLEMILVDRHYHLDYVKTLGKAAQYLASNKPDVVILDNKLPDGWGVDYTSEIRKNFPEARIIMISGNGLVRDEALENGADHFLTKPFSLDELYAAIDTERAEAHVVA